MFRFLRPVVLVAVALSVATACGGGGTPASPPKAEAPAAKPAPSTDKPTASADKPTASADKPAAPATSSQPQATTAPAAAKPSDAPAAAAKPAAKPELAKLDVYSAKDAQMATQALVASSKGYFKEEGLDVDLKYYQAASEIPAGMLGGSIKIGLGGWVNPMQVAANDFPVKVVAPLSDVAGTTQLVVKPNIVAAKDLEGKKLAMLNIPIIRRFLVDFAKVHSVDFNKITIVNSQPSDSMTAFLKGDVDAVLIWQPFTSQAVKEGGVLMHTGVKSFIKGREGDYRVYYNYGVLFIAEDFIQKNPITTEAFVRAMAKAQDFIAKPENRNEVAQIIAQPLAMQADLARQILGENEYFMKITPDFLKIMQQEIEFYVQAQMLKKAVDPKTLVDGAVLKKVRSDWVTQ
ncbi:MAG: ABC transporter substrate-binding protein [Chloroflexi bacterium]|nr:ABC transporter substrate-binding protein [Chloroflexota bacterium]